MKEMFPEGPISSAADVLLTITSSVMNGSRDLPVDVHGTGIMSTFVPIVVVIVEHADTVPTGFNSSLEITTSGYRPCTKSSGTINREIKTEAMLYGGAIDRLSPSVRTTDKKESCEVQERLAAAGCTVLKCFDKKLSMKKKEK